MAHLIAFDGKEPRVAPDAFVAPTAVLIGDVVVEEGASVWFGAVLRGDFNRIVVGAGTSVQDNSVLHTNEELPTAIGRNVTVGHLSLLEGCTVEDGALIGMGSIVLNRARVGSRAMLAAGSVVREDQEIPSEVLAAGVPAQVKKSLKGSSSEWVEMAAREYQALRMRYMDGAKTLASGEGEA
ncbi:MAG TPA: gamma carbonic anhydrase family protein [Rubrobacteraceae bacterium]|nr:gamma carbonic anhydrase family protein [Rubrobacteraceae bacterium]